MLVALNSLVLVEVQVMMMTEIRRMAMVHIIVEVERLKFR